MADEKPTVQKLLEEALAEAELSRRALARLLAGPRASEQQVEVARRQLAKWLAGKHLPSDPNARKLATVLGKEPGYFVTNRRSASRLEELERRMEQVEITLAELQSLVGRR